MISYFHVFVFCRATVEHHRHSDLGLPSVGVTIAVNEDELILRYEFISNIFKINYSLYSVLEYEIVVVVCHEHYLRKYLIIIFPRVIHQMIHQCFHILILRIIYMINLLHEMIKIE
jgi:hypothetical protein